MPQVVTPYYRSLALAILADVTLTVAWAFFSGPTRYLSLATGASFGLGAYITAIGGKGLAWPLPVVAGAVVGAAMALIVGALALRLRGPYVAVFTFGLAELTKHIMALVGGAGPVAGPVVGAVFLGLASEILLLKFRYVYMRFRRLPPGPRAGVTS